LNFSFASYIRIKTQRIKHRNSTAVIAEDQGKRKAALQGG
jgi:hypothetical protein